MLKIAFLNSMSGSQWDAEEENLKQAYSKLQKADFDVICVEEIHYHVEAGNRPCYENSTEGKQQRILVNQYQCLDSLLDEYFGYYCTELNFALHDKNPVSKAIKYGSAIFVRKSLNMRSYKSGFIFREYGEMNDGRPAARAIQAGLIVKEDTAYLIAHFHGLWNKKGKYDCDERMEQSRRVNKFLKKLQTKYEREFGLKPKIILGGDFNLTSETQALKELVKGEAFDGHALNLNQKFNIEETRTSLYKGKIREADFVLVSRDVDVCGYVVDTLSGISDHAPLLLKCE